MHIEIEQSTQQVAANRARHWLPEEIDWVLNKMQDRFISSCLRPKQNGSGGFEIDQAKADHIRMLVTRAELVPYISGTERYKCFLPSNYRNLLADWSYTEDLCGSPVPDPTAQTLYISRQLQHISENEDAPFYESMELMMPDIEVILADLVPIDFAGYPDIKDWSFLVPFFLYHGNKQAPVHWERFDDLYYKNHYVTVRTATSADVLGMTVDGEDHIDGSVLTRQVTYHEGTASKRVNNRLCSTDIIPSLNQSRYYRSAHFSPITELEGTNLIIHRDDSFIVTGAGVSYIRKPQPISLSLGSDCELAGEDTHQAICDLATEYLKGTVQNAEGKQLKTADIVERVIL